MAVSTDREQTLQLESHTLMSPDHSNYIYRFRRQWFINLSNQIGLEGHMQQVMSIAILIVTTKKFAMLNFQSHCVEVAFEYCVNRSLQEVFSLIIQPYSSRVTGEVENGLPGRSTFAPKIRVINSQNSRCLNVTCHTTSSTVQSTLVLYVLQYHIVVVQHAQQNMRCRK